MNNFDYIYSIVELYLKKENDTKKTNLNITKLRDKVRLSFNMEATNPDKASFELPVDEINKRINKILNIYKGDMLIIDEKYELDSLKKNCYYYVKLNNGRILSFINFSILEINNIRNILYNINLYKEELHVDLEKKEEVKMNYKPRLQETGFISFKSIVLMVIFFVIMLVASLWIFTVFA